MGELVRIRGCDTTGKVWEICPSAAHYKLERPPGYVFKVMDSKVKVTEKLTNITIKI